MSPVRPTARVHPGLARGSVARSGRTDNSCSSPVRRRCATGLREEFWTISGAGVRASSQPVGMGGVRGALRAELRGRRAASGKPPLTPRRRTFLVKLQLGRLVPREPTLYPGLGRDLEIALALKCKRCLL